MMIAPTTGVGGLPGVAGAGPAAGIFYGADQLLQAILGNGGFFPGWENVFGAGGMPDPSGSVGYPTFEQMIGPGIDPNNPVVGNSGPSVYDFSGYFTPSATGGKTPLTWWDLMTMVRLGVNGGAGAIIDAAGNPAGQQGGWQPTTGEQSATTTPATTTAPTGGNVGSFGFTTPGGTRSSGGGVLPWILGGLAGIGGLIGIGGRGGGYQLPGVTTPGTNGQYPNTGQQGTGTIDESKLPDWAKTLLKYGVPLATIAALVYGATQMGSKQINPTQVQPTYPEIQKSFGDWLFGQVGKGVGAYPGNLNVDMNQTMLPQVFNNWSPTNKATDYLGNFLNTTLPSLQQQPNPNLQKLMQTGGTGGPGSAGMLNLMQYGMPSNAAGEMLKSVAQYGTPSPGLGKYMEAYAQGWPVYAASGLQQFLTKPTQWQPQGRPV